MGKTETSRAAAKEFHTGYARVDCDENVMKSIVQQTLKKLELLTDPHEIKSSAEACFQLGLAHLIQQICVCLEVA